MRKARLLIALALLLSGLAVVSAPAQAQPSWAPDVGATFNVPKPWGRKAERYRIVEKVDRAIRNARPGSTVLATSYLMDRWDTTNALINACRRGVKVRVILDESIYGRPAKKLIKYLNADNRVQTRKVEVKKLVKPAKGKKGKKKAGKKGKGTKPTYKTVTRTKRLPARTGRCNALRPDKRAAVVKRVRKKFEAEQQRKAECRAERAKRAEAKAEKRAERRAEKAKKKRNSPKAKEAREKRQKRWAEKWASMSKAERKKWKADKRRERLRAKEARAERAEKKAQQRKAKVKKRKAKARAELAKRTRKAIRRAARPQARQIPYGKAKRMARADLSTRASWGPDGSYVKMCKNACRSAHGAMHSKFYLFSETGNAKNVVMVSSSNLNKGGANLGWNDMWTMRSAPKSFRLYRKQHRKMTREKMGTKRGFTFKDKGTKSRFYPRIQGDKRKDPVMAELEQITCRTSVPVKTRSDKPAKAKDGKAKHKKATKGTKAKGAKGPQGTKAGKKGKKGKKKVAMKKVATQVHVSMFWWSGKRGERLAGQIIRLGKKGCNVKVNVGAPSRKVITRLRTAAQRGRIELWDSRHDLWGDELPDVRSHQKLVLVKGKYGKDPMTTRVFTGSMNWTGGALQFSDENTLMLTASSAYRAYLANWKKVRKKSRYVAG